MDRKQFYKLLLLRSVGNFLVLFALFGIFATIGPALFYEVRFQIDNLTGTQYVVAQTDAPNQLKTIQNNQKVLIPPDTYFSIVIPKIGASSRVIINVDPTNEKEYLAALQKGVAHAKGTVFPGMNGISFYFSHSTDSFWDVGRYNAIFYLLKDMQIGDDIYIYFKNYRYNYKVTQTEILDPSDVSLLVNAQKVQDQEVVLQTCWPPGTTWKRFIVIAKPVK
ncbi:MAG TPA: sortase [Patescibacteria group bacterium]|nr:sortase [Patescibacteria group bacterium]